MKERTFFGGLILLGVVFLILSLVMNFGTEATTVTRVKKLDHKVSSDGNGNVTDTYLLFTDAGVFENSDSLFRGKFNSSDMQNSIEEGKTYRLYHYGYRMPFFSAYPNVYKIEEVTQR